MKNETNLCAPDAGQRFFVERRNLRAVEQDAPARGAVYAAQQVKQSRFAAARRPHQRDEVTSSSIEAYAAQRRDAARAAIVDLFNIINSENRQSFIN